MGQHTSSLPALTQCTAGQAWGHSTGQAAAAALPSRCGADAGQCGSSGQGPGVLPGTPPCERGDGGRSPAARGLARLALHVRIHTFLLEKSRRDCDNREHVCARHELLQAGRGLLPLAACPCSRRLGRRPFVADPGFRCHSVERRPTGKSLFVGRSPDPDSGDGTLITDLLKPRWFQRDPVPPRASVTSSGRGG